MAQIDQNKTIYQHFKVTPPVAPVDLIFNGKYVWVLSSSNVYAYEYYDYNAQYDIVKSEYDWTEMDALQPPPSDKVKLVKSVISSSIAPTNNITSLSGEITLDSIPVVSNQVVSLTSQSTPSQNGTYAVSTSSWLKLNNVSPVTTKFNITLSGEQTINSVAINTGAVVSLTHQTNTSENGTYAVSTGSWIKIPSTTPISANSNLTLNGTGSINLDVLPSGNLIKLTAQTDTTQNGTYVISTGSWVKTNSVIKSTSTDIGILNGNKVASGTYATEGTVVKLGSTTYVVQKDNWIPYIPNTKLFYVATVNGLSSNYINGGRWLKGNFTAGSFALLGIEHYLHNDSFHISEDPITHTINPNAPTILNTVEVTYNITKKGRRVINQYDLRTGHVVRINVGSHVLGGSITPGLYIVCDGGPQRWYKINETIYGQDLNNLPTMNTNMSYLKQGEKYLRLNTGFSEFISEGMFIVLTNQTDPTQNGTWFIPDPTYFSKWIKVSFDYMLVDHNYSNNTGGWTNIPYTFSTVLNVDIIDDYYSHDVYPLTSYYQKGGLWYTSANINVVTNSPNEFTAFNNETYYHVNSIWLSEGNDVHCTNQTDPTENGYYIVTDGDWAKYNPLSVFQISTYVPPFGEKIVNGTSYETGDKVYVQYQNNTSDNGIYIVSTGPWIRLSSNSITTMTTNVPSLSGEQVLNSTSLIEGNIVDAQHQDVSSQNGLYIVSSGPWIKLTQDISKPSEINVNVPLSGEQTLGSISVISGDIVNVQYQTNTSDNGAYAVTSSAWKKLSNYNTPKVLSANVATLSGEQNLGGLGVISGDIVNVQHQTNTTQNGLYLVSTSAWKKIATSFTNFCSSGTHLYLFSPANIVEVSLDTMKITDVITSTFQFNTNSGIIYADKCLWGMGNDFIQRLELDGARTWSTYTPILPKQVSTRKFCSGKNGFIYISCWNSADVVKLSTSNPVLQDRLRIDFTPDLIKFDEALNVILVHTGKDKIVAINRDTDAVTNLYYTQKVVNEITTTTTDGAHWFKRLDGVLHKMKLDRTTMLRTKEILTEEVPITTGTLSIGTSFPGMSATGGSVNMTVPMPTTNTRMNDFINYNKGDVAPAVITAEEPSYSFTLDLGISGLGSIAKIGNTTHMLMTPEYNVINHNNGYPLTINEYLVAICGNDVVFLRNKDNFSRLNNVTITGQGMIYSGDDFFTGDAP